jgi:uroporphyrinogen-III synthase
MPVLVTRPQPDDEATASALRARGYDVLQAPMLRFEPVAVADDEEEQFAAVIVTSANALRGLVPQPRHGKLLKLPLFAVGEQTASAARAAGFENVISANGDAGSLRDLVLARQKARQLNKADPLLYLAGADLARDLGVELGERGFTVVTRTTYRMSPVSALPPQVCEAFAANRIEAVLHYSRRSARAFLEAARNGGVEISALAVPQCCISDGVASVLRDAGATQVHLGASPDEKGMFGALERALRPVTR